MKKENEIKLLQKALRNPKATKQEYVRIKAVQLKKQGYPRKEIAKILQIGLSSLGFWIAAFNKKGIEGLKTKKREDGSRAKLSRKEKDEIKKIIKNKKPKDLNLKGEFWNLHNLKLLVKKKYKMEYENIRSYQRLLKYCGFTYQKVQFEDKRKNNKETEDFKLRFKKKSKKGIITMWW